MCAAARTFLQLGVLLFVPCILGNMLLAWEGVETDNYRNGKIWLPLFRSFRFKNVDCVANTAGKRLGTCYTPLECRKFAGTEAGKCAKGQGVCCIVEKTCGGTTNVAHTYFVNPGYPASTTSNRNCVLTVNKRNNETCQVRVDFLNSVELASPDALGECKVDKLTIEGGASEVPELCGDLTGQHVYVDFEEASEAITINVNVGGGDDDRNWYMNVTQIPCESADRVMSGCLQHYKGETGTVTSFNYARRNSDETNENTDLPGTREIENLNYGVCIEQERDFCSIVWRRTDATSFSVSGDPTVTSTGVVADALNGTNCTEDYVVILSGYTATSRATSIPNADRFCGSNFFPVRSDSRPFVLTVVTNGTETDPANRGFSLSYRQVKCGTSDTTEF